LTSESTSSGSAPLLAPELELEVARKIEPSFCVVIDCSFSFLVSPIEEKKSLTLYLIDSKPFAKGERVCSNLVEFDNIGTDILILFNDDDVDVDVDVDDDDDDDDDLPFLG
jgi:hypothetical protein